MTLEAGIQVRANALELSTFVAEHHARRRVDARNVEDVMLTGLDQVLSS